MAIYFPPFFCGKGTVIKAKREFVIDFGNSETVSFGERCIVDEIVGYGYNIKRETGHKVFRIMKSLPDNE